MISIRIATKTSKKLSIRLERYLSNIKQKKYYNEIALYISFQTNVDATLIPTKKICKSLILTRQKTY